MSFIGDGFDTDTLPEPQTYEPIPAGWYSAAITTAELKETKAGTGRYVSIRFDVLGPAYQGRVVFGNINIQNPNTTCEEIGRRQLGEIMRAIGLKSVTDTDELIGGNLAIKVRISKSEEYGDKNEVNGFAAIEGSEIQVSAQSGIQGVGKVQGEPQQSLAMGAKKAEKPTGMKEAKPKAALGKRPPWATR